MNLTKLQFDFLVYIESHSGEHLTQRDIALSMDISLGSVNKFITFFVKEKLIEVKNKCISITKKGLEFLEPYRVKNAIILAAGFSERLAPLTLTTPKPLVEIKGVRIIDTILDALYAKDIKEIYIVVGYKKEQFEVLKEKYPTIKLIENPLFNEAGNIASLYVAKEHLKNSYIIEADLFANSDDILNKFEYYSNYRGIYEDVTEDWCFSVKNFKITKTAIGGKKVYRMVGISFWDKTDSLQLMKDVDFIFNLPGGKENFWDKIPLVLAKKNYSVHVLPLDKDKIIEIDNYKDLIKLDRSY